MIKIPNWSSNSLTVTGDQRDVAAFLLVAGVEQSSEYVLTDAKSLLGTFVPMPSILGKINRGSVEIDGKRYEAWTVAEDGTKRPVSELEQGMLARAHGAVDWYDWALNNWGTKWDTDARVSWMERLTSVRFVFDTAWAPPTEWLRRVSLNYPRLSFRLACAEQGAGFAEVSDYECGVATILWEYNGPFYRDDFDWDSGADPDEGLVEEVSNHLVTYDLHPGG